MAEPAMSKNLQLEMCTSRMFPFSKIPSESVRVLVDLPRNVQLEMVMFSENDALDG